MRHLRALCMLVLGLVIAAGTMNFVTSESDEIKANVLTVKNMNLGTGGIDSPTVGGNATGDWEGSKVYFGAETNKNIWRVLDPATGLLFADEAVEKDRAFDVGSGDGVWSTSELKDWLNGAQYKTNTAKFNVIEQGLVRNDVSLLTSADAQNTSYGFISTIGASNTRVITNSNKGWWLQTSGTTEGLLICYVGVDGTIDLTGDRFYELRDVRPTLQLDMNSVYLTTASASNKSDFEMVDDNHVNDNTWSLTLRDGDTNFSTDTLPTTATIGEDITIEVTSVGSGTYNQTSAILEDVGGNIIAYGKIGDATLGEKNLTIPSTAVTGDYTLRVFQEQVNASASSDYASKEVTTTIKLANASHDVQVTAGNHMTKTSTSGNETQNGVSSAITSIVYTADAGYYFPVDYSVTSANGITITRDSFSQISVAGTPTTDTNIILQATTEKSLTNAPNTLQGDIHKITGTTSAMEYASNPNTTTWTTCTDGSTNVTDGTWYVRYKETATTKASNVIKIDVNLSTIDNVDGSPKTGDHMNFLWLLMLAVLSGDVVLILYVQKKKTSRNI